ncbi:plasma membrane ATPase [Tanacetum coccineum]|uniref:Plasma membrane ATPase n=1 Tax=Tanacetum coccineum TaxID=301880 RepID=A0ABQ5BXD7_9ASTR
MAQPNIFPDPIFKKLDVPEVLRMRSTYREYNVMIDENEHFINRYNLGEPFSLVVVNVVTNTFEMFGVPDDFSLDYGWDIVCYVKTLLSCFTRSGAYTFSDQRISEGGCSHVIDNIPRRLYEVKYILRELLTNQSVKLGDIIPADARSTCKQGEIETVVIATGVHTFFGKAAHLVDSTNKSAISKRNELTEMESTIFLVLLIGDTPIAMPTVLSVTMAIGSHMLPEQGAITKRNDSHRRNGWDGSVCEQVVPEKTKESPGGLIRTYPILGSYRFIKHNYEIVKKLKERKHLCGMTGDGVNDATALKRADIGQVSVSLLNAVASTIYHDLVFMKDFGVKSIRNEEFELMSALYLQVSIISQALIFVSRSRSWSFFERPGLLLLFAFFVAQLIATQIAVYANWDFARVRGIGWGWGGGGFGLGKDSTALYPHLDVFGGRFIIRLRLEWKVDLGSRCQWCLVPGI